MTKHPINLTVRFCLELAMLISLGIGGWHLPVARWAALACAIGLPLAAAILWGIVATKDDFVRSTSAPIMVPGWARLALETLLFAGAAVALFASGYVSAAWTFSAIVVAQNLVSYDRWARLLRL
jgi:hypothetical protein